MSSQVFSVLVQANYQGLRPLRQAGRLRHWLIITDDTRSSAVRQLYVITDDVRKLYVITDDIRQLCVIADGVGQLYVIIDGVRQL